MILNFMHVKTSVTLYAKQIRGGRVHLPQTDNGGSVKIENLISGRNLLI